MSDNKIVTSAAERLGLGDEVAVHKKAEEFLRVLQTKNAAVKNINDFAKTIMCLDLAASMLGTGFDKETALKLSGTKKSVYLNSLNNIEKVLDIGKPITIPELCVQIGCTEAKELAAKILEAYKTRGIITDFSHPQYVAVCVYVACKLMGHKVPRAQIIEFSRLKQAQWKELEADLQKYMAKIGFVNERNGKKVAKKNELDAYLEEVKAQKNEKVSDKSPNKKHLQKEEIEDYEVWKTRILKTARENLRKTQE